MGWGAVFGAAVGLVLALALAMRPTAREPDAVILAWLLLASWATSNLLTTLGGVPVAAAVYPFMDAAGLLVAEALRLRRPALWKALVSLGFAAALLLHLVFWTGAAPARAYALGLNLIFAVQLLAVGWFGLRRLMAIFFDWLLVSPRDYDGPRRGSFLAPARSA